MGTISKALDLLEYFRADRSEIGLSEFVRLAASGETILITDRDRVVAELAPPREGRSPALDDAKLADMVREGRLKPPLLRGLGPPPSDPILPFDELMSDLGRSREDR